MNEEFERNEKPRRGLGKGLEALFGDAFGEAPPTVEDYSAETKPPSYPAAGTSYSSEAKPIQDFGIKTYFGANNNSEEVVDLKVIDLEPNSSQPRKKFDKEKLEALADSIRTHGLIQPVLVKPTQNGTYQIIAGERRWRAAKLADVKTLPCIVRDCTEREIMEIALIENLQREDLNPIEEAEGYKRLMLTFGLTQEVISERVGKSRPAVANALRLNNLPEEIKEMLLDDKMSGGHARAILGITDGTAQLEVAQKVVTEGLSVRQTEAIIGGLSGKKSEKPKSKIDKALMRYYMDVEKLIGSKLGTKVKIYPGKLKNKIEIEYYTREDLERLLEQLT